MSERFESINDMFVKAGIGSGLFIAVMTDAVICGRANSEADKKSLDPEKLLELRVFGPDREALYRRDYTSEEFACRTLSDACGLKYLDEEHFLDIARVKDSSGDNTTFMTLTGGEYTLPVGPDTAKILVRTYFMQDESSGIEYPVDWRAVGFR